ncbi:tyrosine-type recombinase/integrase [Mycobacterium marinum]|uniref:tyrosine-type recombinase/integrase n=2 Tax=Mycobacterium marinum TaxID=1781 RepID=UPI000B971A57|nr:site-specific integrase [Mycobacterium marinum]MDC8981705.1 site-specific integrase [Mycobacterium marinum]
MFVSKMNAEAWLKKERDYKERAIVTGETWKPPRGRAVEKKAKVLTLAEYGKTVIDQRILKPRTRLEYEAKCAQLIEPKLGRVAVRDLSTTAVRAWFSALDPKLATRNAHAYGILSMICNTAVRDGLLDRNPCQIVGATNPKAKKKVKPVSTVELHAIADKLAAEENTARFKALVLLAGWCGLRYGEVSELRRRDFNADCSVLTVSRAVTHSLDPTASKGASSRCRIDTTKNGEERTVTIPPHIREDVKAHLASHTGKSPASLLFTPARGGCHLGDCVFNKDVFQKAAKDLGREDLSAHDLRRFAGSKNAQVGTLTENMARLGHKTVEAALRYQHSQDGRGAIVAASLSANALAELAAAAEQAAADKNASASN